MGVKLIKKHGSIKRKEASAELKLSLPTGKSVPSDSLQDYSILIYGKKKIGKTTLAAQFDDTLFLMCEPGGKALNIRQVQVRNWPEFKGYVDLAVKDEDTKTVIVDTADFCYEYCMDYVCEKLVMDHPSDEGYGKGWKAVRSEFTKVIGILLHSGKGIIFISHSKDEEFKTRRSETYHKVVSSMPGKAKDVLEGLVDIWANYDYDGRRRILVIGGSDEVDAGHRIDGRFKYPNGEPINVIPMGRSPKEGYRNFVQAFENKMPGESEVKNTKKLVIKQRGTR